MLLLIIGIILVIIYDFTNGFHDAADMVATAIASHSLSPLKGILLVTFFTFIGPFVGQLAVANTIGELVNTTNVDAKISQIIAISAVLTAIFYNLLTWKLNLPSSSSNSLAGGLIGSGIYLLGLNSIEWGFDNIQAGHLSGLIKIIIGIFISPTLGFISGFIFIKFFRKILSKLTIKSKKFVDILHTGSIATLSFSHGLNDAQKGMGIITMLLMTSGNINHFEVPFWVILTCSISITIGTLFGGWGIIKTVGFGIYRVKLIHSLSNQISSGLVVYLSSLIGAPTSTTQVVTTSLAGVGSGERPKHVKWNSIFSILKGWMFNIPISIIFGFLFSYLFTFFLGVK